MYDSVLFLSMKNNLITIISIMLFIGVTILFPHRILAVDCTVPASGNISISSSCTFPGTINGADAGTGTTNTASVTVSNGATLTVGATQTIAVGSLIPSGGSIAIITGGQIKIGSPLWMTDADADGYPSATTQVLQASAPTNGRRRNLMTSMTTLDCNDGANSPANTCTLANGLGCSTGTQCTSGFCADGVCCNTACTGSACQRCDSYSNAGAGTCGYISTAVDPDNECTPAVSIYNSSANAKTCNTVCAEHQTTGNNCSGSSYACSYTTAACISIGTDYGGTDGGKVRWTSANGCFVQFDLNCTTTTGNNGVVCSGITAAWTYCRCQ